MYSEKYIIFLIFSGSVEWASAQARRDVKLEGDNRALLLNMQSDTYRPPARELG